MEFWLVRLFIYLVGVASECCGLVAGDFLAGGQEEVGHSLFTGGDSSIFHINSEGILVCFLVDLVGWVCLSRYLLMLSFKRSYRVQHELVSWS